MQELMTMISTVGFPIVSFLIAAYGLKYSYDKSLDMNNKNLSQIAELTEAVNNNTIVLTKLVDKIGGDVDEVG